MLLKKGRKKKVITNKIIKNMEVTGILVKQIAVREGVSQRNGNPWKIGEYLVEIPGQYPRHIAFRVSDGQVGRLARFDSLIGKTVTVSFDIDAHEHEGRWYNEVRCFNVLRAVPVGQMQQPVQAQPAQQPAAAPFPPASEAPAEGSADDLPF